MISYMPLVTTLKKKKMNISMLQEKLGKQDNFLKKCLNEKRYISLKTIDEICTALNCKVEDVVKWESGEQKTVRVEKNVCVDWNKLKSSLTELGVSYAEASKSQGHSAGWLHGLTKRNSMSKAALRGLCATYGFEYESLIA